MSRLGEVIFARLAHESAKCAVRFLASDGGIRELSRAELTAQAFAVADLLDARGIAPRAIVGVAMYSGPALYASWLGCLWSGRIPTMVAPPSPRMEPQKYAAGLKGIVEHLDLAALMVDAASGQALAGRISDGVNVIELGEAAAASTTRRSVVATAPNSISIIQHSSGTTGLQKSIPLTSEQILAHHAAYAERIGLTQDDKIVSWLPLYHDMGFVAAFLLPLIAGLEITEFSPFDWANRPGELLKAIDRYKSTLCWMPNFAFAMLAEPRTLRSLPALDLSSVRAWINCSEPVMAATMETFLGALAPFSVRPRSVQPCYAMAENVFAVSQMAPGEQRTLRVDRDLLRRDGVARLTDGAGLALASNGECLGTTQVQVRDPEGKALPDGRVGEFCLRGAHRFDGYLNRPDLTAAAIDGDGWYATGDLGFRLDGHLYVTGRKKDILILRGRNYYAQDIEDAVAALDGIKSGRVVAFSLPNESQGTEKLVVLVELEDGQEARAGVIKLDIRNCIAQNFDTTPSDVRVVPARWLVKSTSGKLARGENRQKYMDLSAQGAGSV